MEQAGQSQARLGAFCAARTATDLAHDDQWPDAAFRQVVIGRQARYQHEREQLILEPQ
jgi:hypothetical protein